MLELIEKMWNEREEQNMLEVQSVVWDVLPNLEPNVYCFMSFAHTAFLLRQWRDRSEADLLLGLRGGFEAHFVGKRCGKKFIFIFKIKSAR